MPTLEITREPPTHVTVGSRSVQRNAERLGDRDGHLSWIVDRRESHPERPVGKGGLGLHCGGQRERGLARAAGPDERHQPFLVKQAAQLGELVVSPDEWPNDAR